jgi:hypothetical protein
MKHFALRTNKKANVNEFYGALVTYLDNVPNPSKKELTHFCTYAVRSLMTKTPDAPTRFIQDVMSHAFWATRDHMKRAPLAELEKAVIPDHMEDIMAKLFPSMAPDTPEAAPVASTKTKEELIKDLELLKECLAFPYQLLEQNATDLPILSYQQRPAYTYENALALSEIMLAELDHKRRAEEMVALTHALNDLED